MGADALTRMLQQFWKRFWIPPRAHGEALHERRVSYVELFYDLVFVVIVGASAFAPRAWRLWVCTAFAVIWLTTTLVTFTRRRSADQIATVPRDSVLERFDLLAILVLGEVVAGVVIGPQGSELAATGIVAAAAGGDRVDRLGHRGREIRCPRHRVIPDGL